MMNAIKFNVFIFGLGTLAFATGGTETETNMVPKYLDTNEVKGQVFWGGKLLQHNVHFI